MTDAGVERFRNNLNKQTQKGLGSKTLHGRTIISHAIDTVAEGIDELKQAKGNRNIAKKKLKDVPSEIAAFLSLTCAVDTMTINTKLMTLAHKIGKAIEIQDRLHKWVQQEGQSALRVIEMANEKGDTAKAVGLIHKMNKDGYSDLSWTKEEQLHVGFNMVDIIIVKTGLLQIYQQPIGNKKVTTHVAPTEKTTEWIKAFNDTAEAWKPKLAPCLVEPKDWTDITGGGFYSPYLEPLSIVRRQ